MSVNILGKGTYGTVEKNGNTAVKHFHKLSHLLQEYTAGIYLNDCPYTVNILGFDLEDMTLTMELYQGSLKDWISEPRSFKQKLIMFREILKGLVWVHDLGLVHGDLKPGNCVARWDSNGNLTKVVLADLGFVAPENYAKAERTAPVYREIEVERDFRHDIYSLGVMGLEAFGDIKIIHQQEAKKLIKYSRRKIKNERMQDIIVSMLNPRRTDRPTARYLLASMFEIKPNIRKHSGIPSYPTGISMEKDKHMEDIFRSYSPGFDAGRTVNRTKYGYNICKLYLAKHSVPESNYDIYAAAMMYILASIFGQSGYGKKGFDMEDAVYISRSSPKYIYMALYKLLKDDDVITYLFYNSITCV